MADWNTEFFGPPANIPEHGAMINIFKLINKLNNRKAFLETMGP